MVTPTSRAAAQPAARFEYKCPEDISVKRLDELGLEGWELVSVDSHHAGGRPVVQYCLKRAL